MAWFALLAGALGFALVYFTGATFPTQYSQYLSLAALAGLDSLIGGVRAGTEGKFKSDVFISGFLTNTLLAAFLAYLGDLMGQPLGLAAVVALGGRIFVNLSIIRRQWLEGRGGENRNGTGRLKAATPLSLEEQTQTQP
jgi:small basic protein